MFPELNKTKVLSHSLTSKWGSSPVEAQKANEKNGVINLFSISPSWVMVLKKLSKIVSLMQLFANVSKKSKAIIAIYYMHQKVLVLLF